MRSCWVLAAGLLLAACRTDGERGQAAPQERGGPAPSAKQGPGERAAVGANFEETSTARVLAATRAIVQGGVDAGKLAEQRATSPEVKAYATRAVAEHQASLDALSDLARAKKIDLDTAAVQGDPLLKADKDLVKDEVDQLRALSGTPFDAAYMTGQRPMQMLLVQLALQGQQVSRDTDVGNVLRTTMLQGRERGTKALSILPKACGGQRPGWGGAG